MNIPVSEAAPMVARFVQREGGYMPASRVWAERFGGPPETSERLFHRITKAEVSRVQERTLDRLWVLL